ncbi:MAG TPA: TonB-dependent receptor [bacterium]
MNKFARVIRYFLLVFLFLPSILRSETLLLEPSGNTLAVEPVVNPVVSQTSVALPEVVVTTNRLNTPVSEVASSLTVITAKDLEQKQSTTVLDALDNVPGVDLVKSGGAGQISSAFIRGGNAEHTLVMMDGIPLNDPLSTTREYDDLAQLSVDNVKQIEVVRGPESPFYGSNAMGGVVNIVTQEGRGPAQGSFLFESGAYNTFRETVSAGAGGGDGNFFLSVSRLDTTGFPAADKSFGNIVNDGDQNTSGFLKLGVSTLPNLESHFVSRYMQSHIGLSQGGGAGMDDPNYFADAKQFVVGNQSTLKLFNGDWEQVLGLSFTDNTRFYTDKADPTYPASFNQNGNYDGQAAQVSWQNNLKVVEGQTLVLGLQGQQDWGNSVYTSDFGNDSVLATARTGSVFVESQTTQGGRFFESLGARLDIHSQFGSHGTYHAGVAYFVPGLETKLKATYGTGFRAPSLYQLYDPLYGNTSLAPEASIGFDAGFEQTFGKSFLTVGATYFHNDFNELIDYDFTTNKYFNTHQAEADGVEAFADFKGVRNLTIRANYTYTNTLNLQTGQPLLRRPQQKAGLDAFVEWGALELGTSMVYTGTRSDVTFVSFVETNIVMPSYVLANLMASFKVDDHLKFFGRVDNLFNQAYEEVYGFGTPGLSVFAGTKVSL